MCKIALLAIPAAFSCTAVMSFVDSNLSRSFNRLQYLNGSGKCPVKTLQTKQLSLPLWPFLWNVAMACVDGYLLVRSADVDIYSDTLFCLSTSFAVGLVFYCLWFAAMWLTRFSYVTGCTLIFAQILKSSARMFLGHMLNEYFQLVPEMIQGFHLLEWSTLHFATENYRTASRNIYITQRFGLSMTAMAANSFNLEDMRGLKATLMCAKRGSSCTSLQVSHKGSTCPSTSVSGQLPPAEAQDDQNSDGLQNSVNIHILDGEKVMTEKIETHPARRGPDARKVPPSSRTRMSLLW